MSHLKTRVALSIFKYVKKNNCFKRTSKHGKLVIAFRKFEQNLVARSQRRLKKKKKGKNDQQNRLSAKFQNFRQTFRSVAPR